EYDAKLIVIGNGELSEKFLYSSLNYPEVFFVNRYDESLAHLLYAASDFFLMPSYFEPCGTSQLISMRYGSVPIVSDVGGLNDTVIDISQGDKPTGFVFKNSDYFGLINSFNNACLLYSKNALGPIIMNGMTGDYSWNKSAREYISLYDSITWK
ncbi:MAG: glycosyltransferase, partial [Bacilli bacterium]